MEKDELEELRQEISKNNRNQEKLNSLKSKFTKAQNHFLIEGDEEKDVVINTKIRSAFMRDKPKEASDLMLNQISKWMRRINDNRA